MKGQYNIRTREDSSALALHVVAWTVSDAQRAQRMLALTGLDPDALRAQLDHPTTLRALLDFVLDHEPDLMACAAALGVEPAAIAAARRDLAQ